MRTSKATCSELAIARVSHCHLGFGRNLKADRVGNLYWKKGKGFGYVMFVILQAWVNCRWAN